MNCNCLKELKKFQLKNVKLKYLTENAQISWLCVLSVSDHFKPYFSILAK